MKDALRVINRILLVLQLLWAIKSICLELSQMAIFEDTYSSGSLEAQVSDVMNPDCKSVSEGCDRERYLKLLDNGVKLIPVLNNNHGL